MINIENTESNDNKTSNFSEEKAVEQSVTPIPPFKAVLNRWVKVQAFFTGDDGIDSTYYLTRNPSNSSCSVTNVSNHSASSNDPTYSGNQMWQLTNDGHILSTSGNVVLDVNGSTVITSGWNSSKTQLWTIDNNTNKIMNQGTGQYLDINSLHSVTAPLNGNATQKWYFGPTYPLSTILQEAPQQFPQYPSGSGELVAYQYISESLVPGCIDIRSQYINLTQTSNFIPIMNALPCPPGCTQQQFDDVKSQLSSEFICVNSINSLFQYYGQFHTELFTNSQALLNGIIVSLGLQTGSNSQIATGAIGDLFEGILYTALSFAPGVGPLIANIIQTAVDIGVSYSESGSGNAINPDPFQVAVANLWNFLSTSFITLLNITGQIQTQLLSDWGMMQAAYKCTTILTGPSSLAWTPNTASALLSSCQVGYTNSVVQYLMPINYQIYVVKNSDKSNLPDHVPSSCLYSSGSHIYFVASNQTSSMYPTDSFMNTYIWGNYVNKDQFYLSQNGWNFPTSTAAAKRWRSGTPIISNNTSIPMNISIQVEKTSYNESLNTNSSFIYVDSDSSSNPLPELSIGTNSTFKVTEKMTGNTVATFNYFVEQNAPIEGCYIILKSSSVSNGYKLGTSIENQGNYSDGFSSSILASIYVNK